MSKYDWADLTIIGDGPEFINLQNLKRKYEIENVFLKGQMNSNEVANQLNKSDVFILNSYYEGLSHCLIEACVFALPIIARNAGGNSEIVKDGFNGYLYKDLDGLQESIKKIKDNKIRKKFSSNSRLVYEENFNSEKTYEKYLNLIFK